MDYGFFSKLLLTGGEIKIRIKPISLRNCDYRLKLTISAHQNRLSTKTWVTNFGQKHSNFHQFQCPNFTYSLQNFYYELQSENFYYNCRRSSQVGCSFFINGNFCFFRHHFLENVETGGRKK